MGGILGGDKSGTGGISPEQMALAQFTFGQNAVANANAFRKMPMSTGLTQADAGAGIGEASQIAGMSMADTQAQNAANAQSKASLSSGIGNLGTTLGGGGGGSTGTSF